MSTHTTYFCDHCNSDRDADGRRGDESSAITYSEYPVGDGWAIFEEPFVDSLGYDGKREVHICGHCLADPEFEPEPRWTIPSWDEDSRKNLEQGRKHAVAFTWARETLGTRDRFGFRGVRQALGRSPYGYQVGPRLSNGKFEARDAAVTA